MFNIISHWGKQIKTTTKYNFESSRIDKIKDRMKCLQGCGEIGIYIHCGCTVANTTLENS